MAYATNADLLLEFKGLVYGNNLQAATVDEWCNQASNRIDSYLTGRYVTPVNSGTSPIAFSILKNICIQIVKLRMNEFLRIQTGDEKTSQGGVSASPKQIASELESLRDLKTILKDAVLATATDGATSFDAQNTATVKPTFNKGTDQW